MRGRRNPIGLSASFTGPSGPDDEEKGSIYVTCLVTEYGCFHYKMLLVNAKHTARGQKQLVPGTPTEAERLVFYSLPRSDQHSA